ncbi:hypothetical protein [Haloprofundus halobius]|uniref:hypothetical protein n=1 Tax=Haloprofundus halobius TaxID=2876194 RepID=UPI001CCA9DA2|nr:hypothetical protein [Haloprofundus halobius]
MTFQNGINARDVGLFSGNPPGAPEAGAIWFGTNTAVHQAVGIDTTPAPEIAALDVAFVDADEAAGVLVVTLDGNFFGLPAARSSLLNCVTPTDGLLAPIYQLIQGTMQLQFGDGGNAVSGVVDFVGNGYIEPGTTPYQATMSGARVA